MNESDTIAAIATPLGEGGVAIIRISGVEAVDVVDRIFRSNRKIKEQASHTLTYGHIVDPQTQETVDEVLVALMRAPRSYTKEDVVEIHSHGGIIAVQRILQLVLRHGARLAEPGEFTKRAFLNGRIDLAQAEAVIDLIRAKTEEAQRLAMRQVAGQLSQAVRSMRQQLLELLAHVEVTFDYPEHDVEDVTAQHILEQGQRVVRQLDDLLRGAKEGKILREGLNTVILGRPNVGKSSLLNALARSERAIVTEIPGTTRDLLEEQVSLRGIPLRIIDTAGIRETEDVVEKIGVKRSRAALAEADLVFYLVDASRPLEEEDQKLLFEACSHPLIVILNKWDLPHRVKKEDILRLLPDAKVIEMSLKEGRGMRELEEEVQRLFFAGSLRSKEATYVSNSRHIALLEQAKRELEAALSSTAQGLTLDLIAVDLHAAWETLGEVIGERVGDDLLDQIFSQFCLGK